MEELTLQQPELIGREEELSKLKNSLDNAIDGHGSTLFISGEAGIGKTRLVSELIKEAESKGVQVIQGWCLAESLEPLMPIKSALREGGFLHLVSGDPPPLVVSAYLTDGADILIAKSEREELDLDPHIFASMLQAVGTFVKDSMQMIDKVERTGGLNILGYKEFKILVEEKDGLHLATVTKGTLSEFLLNDMREVLSEVQKRYGDVLADWNGDFDNVVGVEGIVSRLVTSGKYNGKFLVDDPKIKQDNLFDSILVGLQRLSAERPHLIHLDDLQWADPTTLNLIHYLSRNTQNDGIMIVCNYRTEDIAQSWDGKTHHLVTTMQNMNRSHLLQKVTLERLDLSKTKKMVESTLGATSFDHILLERIYQESEGNPFFILEVIQLLIEENVLYREKDQWIIKTEIDKIDIPSKIYDVVKRRLDRLIQEQREILECASVVGEEFSTDLLEKATAIQKLKLLKNLSHIEKTHKLIHYLKEKYRFDHSKVREVLYNGISEELRKEYHRLIGDTIVKVFGDNMEDYLSDLAYHYYEAGDERAGEYLIEAGDEAKERYANEEAIRFYKNSLTFVEEDKLSEIRVKMGDLLALNGDFDEAIESFENVLNQEKENKTKADLYSKIADVYEKKGEYEQCKQEAEKGLALLEDDECIEKGRILGALGAAVMRKGDFDKAYEILKKYLDIANTFKDEFEIAKANHYVGAVFLCQGNLPNALTNLHESLKIRREIDDFRGQSTSLINIGNVYFYNSEFDKALESFEESLEISKMIGDKQTSANSLNNIAGIHHLRGDMDNALEIHDENLKIMENIGDKYGIGLALGNIGIVYIDKNDNNTAIEFLRKSLEILEDIGEMRVRIYNYCGLAQAYFGQNDLEKSLAAAEKARDLSVEVGMKSGESKSYRILGMINREKNDWDTAIEYLEKSKTMDEETGDVKELGEVHYEYGKLYKMMNKPDDAREHLEKAREMFENIGKMPWIEKCEKELEELES